MSGNTNEVKLHRFDPEKMLRPDATVLCVGARGSGKTTMMLYLLSCMAKRLDMCVAFCPTDDTRKAYEEVLPKCFVYPEYDRDRLTEIVAAQRALNKLHTSGTAAPGSTNTQPLRKIGILLDDCMYDKNMLSGKTMRYLLMNGRHDSFFYINGVQYMMDLSKDSRSQIDVAVVFREPNVAYRKALRENLLGIFDTDEQLVRVFDEGLREHEALVFDQRAFRARKPCLFYCKAPLVLPRFRVGCDAFWLLYYKYFVRQRFGQIGQLIQATLAAAKGRESPLLTNGDGDEGAAAAADDVPSTSKARIARGGKVILPICRVGDVEEEEPVPAEPRAHSSTVGAPAATSSPPKPPKSKAKAKKAPAGGAHASTPSFSQALASLAAPGGGTKPPTHTPAKKKKQPKRATKADAAKMLAPLPPLPSITECVSG